MWRLFYMRLLPVAVVKKKPNWTKADTQWINLHSLPLSISTSSFFHRSTLSGIWKKKKKTKKKRRVSRRPRNKIFYCVNYLEVKAGWDSTVLYRQERLILMSGDVKVISLLLPPAVFQHFSIQLRPTGRWKTQKLEESGVKLHFRLQNFTKKWKHAVTFN